MEDEWRDRRDTGWKRGSWGVMMRGAWMALYCGDEVMRIMRIHDEQQSQDHKTEERLFGR